MNCIHDMRMWADEVQKKFGKSLGKIPGGLEFFKS
jgi:hypothetical protein